MKKILIGLLVFVLLIVGALFAIPILFKDKINAVVKEEINKSLNAKVDYSDYSLSLIRSFPNFNFSLTDLTVVGTEVFAKDTLVAVEDFNFSIDLMSVINGGQIKIVSIGLIKPVVNAIVLEDGKANWDIVKADDQSTGKRTDEPTQFSLAIEKYLIEAAEIVYDDRKGKTKAVIHDFDFVGSGNVSQDVYDFATKTSIVELSYKTGSLSYLSKARFSADVNVEIDNKQRKYTLKDNRIELNDLGLSFNGFVQTVGEALNLDMKFKSKDTEFKSILSMIPAVYKKDFDKVKTSGLLSLEGFVKGKYEGENYPELNLKLNVSNGMFQYPDLPVAVKNISIFSSITKPQGGLDATIIDISKFHIDAGGDPVDAKLYVKTPISDPEVKVSMRGRLDLANVPKFYPMEGLKKMSGVLNMDLNFKGKQSDLDKRNFAAIDASGNAGVKNLVYESAETPMPVNVYDMQMSFNPKSVVLSSFISAIGSSDFNATGELGNFVAYAFGKGDLSGRLDLKSKQFNANEWLNTTTAPESNSTKSASSSSNESSDYFKVPEAIDFKLNSEIGKILYDKLVLENLKGQILIKEEAIYLNDLFANLLGGSATISAKYDTHQKTQPDVTFSYDIKNFDFAKTSEFVGMSEKIAPVIKYIKGSFSSDLKGSGKLNPDMSVDYNTLTGDGTVSVPSAKIVGMPILQKVTEVAKIPALQNLEVRDAWTVLKFKDGKVNVEPTDFKFGNGYKINVQGTNGFDSSIDYDMRLDIPSKELGAATSLANSYLAKIPGISASMPDVLGFKFKVTGTAAKPKVTLVGVQPGGGSSAKDMLKNTAGDLKKQAEEEAKKQLEDAKKKAEQELLNQKEAAEKKLKEEAEKAKQEAEKKAKEAAEKAKKEAEKKAKEIFKFPK